MPLEAPSATAIDRKISQKYTLGEELGRGAFASVYECRNSLTGETVAVKRIGLRNLSKESLVSIEQEVSLLKRLDHPNIVKYIDTVRTNGHLHIVLEYMENGSLARNLKLFGTLSQALCAIYVRQVLQGLGYLHEQGVIHRDIKSANILTTKQGLVKLADFGVATHTSATSNEVVGTPYWMSPEIIEMAPPTSASDIWGVGCTVIELLTSKPPHFDIPPMAALYRIVQDEHPPLPEGISPALRDFLLLCFKKEPLLRTPAKELLKHRWIHKPRAIKESQFTRADEIRIAEDVDLHEHNTTHGDSEVGFIASSPKTKGSFRPPPPALPNNQAALKSSVLDDVRRSSFDGLGDNNGAVQVSEEEITDWRRSVINTVRLTEEQLMAAHSAEKQVESKKKSSPKKEPAPVEDDDEDWDWHVGDSSVHDSQQCVRVSETPLGAVIKDQYRAMLGSGKSVETSSQDVHLHVGVDFDSEDLDDAFDDGIGQPENISSAVFSAAASPNTSANKLASKLAKFQEDTDAGVDEMIVDFEKSLHRAEASGDKEELASDLKHRFQTQLQRIDPGGDEEKESNMDAFDEQEDDDFEEDHNQKVAAELTTKVDALIGLLSPNQDDNTILNACAELANIFREQPSQRRTLLTHRGVVPIMEMLEMSNPDVLHAILKVVGQIVEDDIDFQEMLSLAGLIPIVAKFCSPNISRQVRLQAASLVKQFLKTSPVTLQMLIACGGLPILGNLLLRSREPESQFRDKRRGWSGFAGSNQQPDIALNCVAVEGIKRVFYLSKQDTGGRATIPKNDFCRLLAKEGILKQLVVLLEYCCHKEGEAECAALGIDVNRLMLDTAELLEVFSLGDSVVKNHFTDSPVLIGIFRILTMKAPFYRGDNFERDDKLHNLDPTTEDEFICPVVKGILKCVKNLSMDPTLLEAMAKADAIPTLVPYLEYCSSMSRGGLYTSVGVDSQLKRYPSHRSGTQGQLDSEIQQLIKEVQNLVVLSMFYLTRLSHSRQEQSAVCGVIPYLMDSVATRSPSRTFALQILTDFAHASDVTRDQLWVNGALNFYLDLLISGDVFWEEKAFSSLSAWLGKASSEVEREMLRPHSLKRLIALFQSAQGNHFENYAKELLTILTGSPRLCEAIGRSGIFMSELITRLSFPKAEVRIILLKILMNITERQPDLENLVLEYNLFPVLKALTQDTSRVLVLGIANDLLDEWRKGFAISE